MTDLEGVACVMNATDWIHPTSKYYEDGKRLLTEEVNAAVEGFAAACATEFVVQDCHGPGAINGLLLDERAELQRGWKRPPYPFGLEDGFDCVSWIGKHPKSGTTYGHLCHTSSLNVFDVTFRHQCIRRGGIVS